MTRQECMGAADRLDEAKRELQAATSPTERADLREEINYLSRQLFLGGHQEPEQ